jgi:hypothetical protein
VWQYLLHWLYALLRWPLLCRNLQRQHLLRCWIVAVRQRLLQRNMLQWLLLSFRPDLLQWHMLSVRVCLPE